MMRLVLEKVPARLVPWGALSLVLLLHACASVQLPAGKAQQSVFDVQARVSVQYSEEQLSGLLHWRAEVDHVGAELDEVLLSSPLGQGLARITRDAGGVMLVRPGEPDVTAENAEKLTESTLGFRLPLNGLRYWIQAKPDTARENHVTQNTSGEITQIVQDGWTIDYLQYRESRPRKINVRREGIQIRLVIDEWRP